MNDLELVVNSHFIPADQADRETRVMLGEADELASTYARYLETTPPPAWPATASLETATEVNGRLLAINVICVAYPIGETPRDPT